MRISGCLEEINGENLLIRDPGRETGNCGYCLVSQVYEMTCSDHILEGTLRF